MPAPSRLAGGQHHQVGHHAGVLMADDVAVEDEAADHDRVGERDDHLHLARHAVLRVGQVDDVAQAGLVDVLSLTDLTRKSSWWMWNTWRSPVTLRSVHSSTSPRLR